MVNRAILQLTPPRSQLDRDSYLVFPSRLSGNKGARLVLHALSRTPLVVRVVFVGDGNDERYLKRLALRLNVADRAEFRGRIERDELFKTVSTAAAAVFAGLREEGGCALSEAMQIGTPVIVLGVGGARQIAEANTDTDRVAIIEPDGPRATVRAMAEAMTRFASDPSRKTTCFLDHEATETALLRAMADVLQVGT